MDIETEVEAEATPSIRDSLERAMETQAEAPVLADDVSAPVESAEGVDERTAEQRARDEAGRFAKKAAEAKAAPVAPLAKAPVAPVVPGLPGDVKPAAVVPEMKAPQSWRGPAKETWGQLPEAARVEVLRREKEIAATLATVGEERKFAQALKQTLAPYEAQIRAEGSTPERAVQNLLQTAQALRTAPPAYKAQLVAGLINDYGIPLDALVASLQGQPVAHQPQQAQHADPETIVQRVEQQLMQRLASQREQAMVQRYAQETDSFLDGRPTHGLDGTDYSQDIREDMADIIERATKRGSPITLERAYTLAARQHTEVSKVLERQEQAAAAAKASASTQRARVAASSVRSSPATKPVTKGESMDLRSTIEAAVGALDGR